MQHNITHQGGLRHSLLRRIIPTPIIPTPTMSMEAAPSRANVGTALITGASSGIGAAFARQLAQRGYHLVLVARRAERLHALAHEIKHTFHNNNKSIEVITADLSVADDIARVEARIRTGNDVTMLINNAGFGTVGLFPDVAMAKHRAMIDVHMMASMRFVHAALPTMIANQHGVIINVSSITSFLNRPGNVTYNASKTFLNTFSAAIQAELGASSPVRVQALCPGLTSTEFFDTTEFASFERVQDNVPSFFWMSADEVVHESLACIARGKVLCVPGIKNRLLLALLQNPILLTFTRMLIAVRKKRHTTNST